MAAPNTQWKVLPHGALSEVDTDLLCVVGELPMPLMDLPRRMTVVRLRDGRLVEIDGLVEKPPQGSAPSNLMLPGRYILQPEVMRVLDNPVTGAGGGSAGFHPGSGGAGVVAVAGGGQVDQGGARGRGGGRGHGGEAAGDAAFVR